MTSIRRTPSLVRACALVALAGAVACGGGQKGGAGSPGAAATRPASDAAPVPVHVGQVESGRAPRMVRATGSFEADDLGVGRSAAVPEIVAAALRLLVVPLAHRLPPSSRSRSIAIPRCKLTRTESGVRPVWAAISGPVIPSTSRRARVSR